LPIDAVNDVAIAAGDANLIVCLTPATLPYLNAVDVRQGTTIAAVGSDTPEKRELSTDLLRSCALVCDVIYQCATVGELHHALNEGVMTLNDVRAEIGEVLLGAAQGRLSEDEIVVFDSTGTAVQDTGPAAAVYLSTQVAPVIDLWASAKLR
jgi:ornithine cyclodeaminase/alanine dehydrogenase-like protein (mu-crystallin family)